MTTAILPGPPAGNEQLKASQKNAAYGVGSKGDTSPRNGCCAVTFG